MKDIKGYEGLYSADESGNIWSHRQRKFLKPWLIGHGYEMVMFYKDKAPRKFLTHRLIALMFVPNPENLREVNHIDGERRNNRPENLEWVTSKENKRHAIALGLYANLGKNPARGEKNVMSKLTESQVIEIFRRHQNWETARALAREFGVSDTLVRAISDRRIWKHVLDKIS